MAVCCAVVEHFRRSLLLDPPRVGDRLLAEEVATELSQPGPCLPPLPSDSLAWSVLAADIIESGITGGAAAAEAVAASADDEGGGDDAADPKLKLLPRPVPKDNFRRIHVVPMPFPPALGEISAAPSVFLSDVRSDAGGDGEGESTLTGDGPGPAVEESSTSLPTTEPAPAPTADIIASTAVWQLSSAKQTPIDLIQPLVTKQCPPVDACRSVTEMWPKTQ